MMPRAALIAVCCVSAFASERAEARRYFEQARQLFEQRKLDEAQAAARKALAADPKMGNAEILLGLVATVKMEFIEAAKHFSRAVALEPQNYQAHAYLGSTFLQQKRLQEAAAAFRKVLELSPGNAAANYNLGVVALAQDSPAAALRFFETVARTNHSDAAALIGMLESQLMLRKTDDARQTATQLEPLLNASDPRLFQIATLLAQHGESAAAIPLMERVRKAFPQSYDVNYNLALAYLQTAKYDRAAGILRPLADAQGRAEAFDLLGTIEEKQGHITDARRAFEESVRREPANEDYRFSFANFLLQHGELEPALAAFRAAVSDLPKSSKLRIGLGSACYLSGDYQGASKELLEAVRLKPDSASAYFLLGEAYDSAERFRRPIETALKSYLETAPRDPWAYYHYAAILYSRAQGDGQGDYQAAVSSLNQALRINPQFAEAHLELGLIALAEGKTDQAISALEKAVSLDPRLAAAHYRLGLAYQRLDDKVRAQEEFKQFRQLKNEEYYRGRVLESLAAMGR
jgi:tetratricopeptide (TPR) repeat protein